MSSAALIFNSASGRFLDAKNARERTLSILKGAGVDATPMEGNLDAQLEQSLASDADTIVVCGGDGTIRAAIDTHRGRGRPIGIIPGGTMNLCAVDFGIPENPAEAARVIARGHTIAVDYGTIDGKVFLHSLFTGLPARIGIHREARRGKLTLVDRLRLGIHAVTTVARDPNSTLTAETDDGPVTLNAQSFALLVGTIGDDMLPRPRRQSVSGGLMTAFAIHPETGIDVARMVLRGAAGQLAADTHVDKCIVRKASISNRRRRMHAMLDGEGALIASPCTVEIVSGEVEVFAPKEAA